VVLGVVGFAGQIPALLLAPLAGVWVDRWNRRRTLLTTQVLFMIHALLLAGLTLTGHITVPLLVFFNVLDGVIMAFDMPTRQVMVVAMVDDKKHLGNAIALHSSLFNLARLTGPAVAGVLISTVGEGWCFLLDAFTFLAVIGALLAMKLPPQSPPLQQKSGAFTQWTEGFFYIWNSPVLRSLIVSLALVGLLAFPYTILIPVMAKTVLHGGPKTLGILMSASGCGALAGALWLASRTNDQELRRVVLGANLLLGLGLMAFSQSTYLPLSLALLMVVGFGFVIQMAGTNTLVQYTVDENKRGRVMSLFMVAFLTTAPLGNLMAGHLAQRLGAPTTLLLGGAGCVAVGWWQKKTEKRSVPTP